MDPDRLARVNASMASREVRYAVPTPDGTFLLEAAGPDGTLVDLPTGEPLATYPIGDPLGPTHASDGSCFACSDGESVQVRSLPEAEVLRSFPVPGPMRLLGRNLLGPCGEFVYLPGPPWPPGDWKRFQSATGEAGPQYSGVSVGHPWGG